MKIKDRLGMWWVSGTPAKSQWSEVLVHPEQVVRHRDWCHRCRRLGARTTGRVRVRLVKGAEAVEHKALPPVVPRSLVVPMCRGCWHGRWTGGSTLVLVAALGLALGVGSRGQTNDPLIDVPRWAKPFLGIALLIAFLAFSAATFGSRFHVVFDGVNLRYTFQDSVHAVDFASDNGARVASSNS